MVNQERKKKQGVSYNVQLNKTKDRNLEQIVNTYERTEQNSKEF